MEKTRKTWCEKNVYPSEPIFVPDPNGKVRKNRINKGITMNTLIRSEYFREKTTVLC